MCARRQTLIMSAQFDEVINFRFDDSEFVIKVGDLMSKVMVVFVTHEVRAPGLERTTFSGGANPGLVGW